MDRHAGLDDESLAAAAAHGDRAAFSELVRRTLPALLGYLHRMVSDPAVADDVAQETWVAAWRSLSGFQHQSSFRTWLFAITQRRIADYRRRRRDPIADVDTFAQLPAGGADVESEAAANSLVAALERELAALPPTPRAVWWLREIEDLPYQDIARILQISGGSVRGHLQRTRTHLSEALVAWNPQQRSAESAAGDTGVDSDGVGSTGTARDERPPGAVNRRPTEVNEI